MTRGGFAPCLAVWCGECYQPHPEDPFPVQNLLHDEDELEDLETDERLAQRFRQGRNGDHLMGIPFQCDLCHFRNVAERDPVEGRAKDEYTMMCIRRANLDAAWSREPSTVQSNLYRLQRDYHDAASSLSIKRLVPRLGNTEIRDSVGMGIAITTLNASLRKGRYTDHLQWDSMRKSRTWYFNAFEAGVVGDKSALFIGSDRKVYTSTSPTSTPWFSRFLLGAKRRMGVHREQNEALSAEQLTAVLNMCERDWAKSRSEEEKKDIESLASFMIIGFCLSLRGEEVPLVDRRDSSVLGRNTRA